MSYKKFLLKSVFLPIFGFSLIIFFVPQLVKAATSSNVYYSQVESVSPENSYTSVNWTDYVPTNTAVSVSIRSGDIPTPDDSWTSWIDVSKNDSIDFLNSKNYYQYRVTIYYSDTSDTPYFQDISFSYSYYPVSASLLSSPYDSNDGANIFAGIKWDEINDINSSIVRLQVRTAPDNAGSPGTWTEWRGPEAGDNYFSRQSSRCEEDGTEISCTVDNSQDISDGVNDRWIQYRVQLETGAYGTPHLQNITIVYVVNATPEFDSASAATDGKGLVDINFSVKDQDTDTGSNTPGYVTPSFEFWNGSSWQDCSSFSLIAQPESTDEHALDNRPVLGGAYTNYSVHWNAKADYNGHYIAAAKIRVTVNDNEAANNRASIESTSFVLDTKDPEVSSVSVDARSDAEHNFSFSVSDDLADSLEIKISNNANLTPDGSNASSGEWTAFSPVFDWNFGSGSAVYYQIRDGQGNISNSGTAQSIQIPEKPSNVFYQDISNFATSEWREFITWERVDENSLPNSFAKYNIYRSTNGENFSLVYSQENRLINYYLDEGLDESNTYYYRISVEDSAGNDSAYSETISDRPDGQGGADLTAPEISNVSIDAITTRSARITWDTDEAADSRVYYQMNDGGDFEGASSVYVSSMANTDSGLGKHVVYLDDLTPGSTYYLQVKSVDPSGNASSKKQGEAGYELKTASGPDISQVTVSEIRNNQVTVSWTTDTSSDSKVFYSSDYEFSSPQLASDSDEVRDHKVVLNNLQPASSYYFYVRSGQIDDKNISRGDIAYYRFITTSDQVAPTIDFVFANDVEILSDDTVRVSWRTSELADSLLEYSTDDSYDHSYDSDSLNTDHVAKLENLEAGTTYNFRLRSRDANSNAAFLNDLEFTTSDSSDVTAPILSSISVQAVYDKTALISWRTNEAADSLIEYGETSGELASSTEEALLNTSHSLVLDGLKPATKYYYRVSSKDPSANSASSEEREFTTTAEMTTEEAAQVREEAARQEGLNEGLSSQPSSGGGSGGVIIIDKTDKVNPLLSDVSISLSQAPFTVSWKTDEPADSLIEYGQDLTYQYSSYTRSLEEGHSLVLREATEPGVYYYRLSSADSSGNVSNYYTGMFEVVGNGLGKKESIVETTMSDQDLAISDDNFLSVLQSTIKMIKEAANKVSLPILEASLVEQQRSLQELAELAPKPIIVKGPEIKIWDDMAVISWETNKKASGQVSVSEKAVPLTSIDQVQVIGNPDVYSKEHQIVISGLDPETTYNYQVKSLSSAGAAVVSRASNFTTAEKEAKVSNYLVENIDEEKSSFRWVSSVPTDSSIRFTPYRNNVAAVDEAIVLNDPDVNTIHEITVDSFEPGVLYKVDIFGQDEKGRVVSESIDTYSTTGEEIPLLIEQVKTNSALVSGNDIQVQSIVSWNTSRAADSKIYYRQGISKDDSYWPSETLLDNNFTRRHLVVMTDFKPGEIYQFQVESTDPNGNKVRSQTYTILTPKQKDSVFQVIMNNIEQTFGWLQAVGK
jgi:hypothetical protein